MGSGGADRLSGAWVLHKAGIYAALVDTGLGLGTVWVRRTFRPRRNWIAVVKGISRSATGARARSPVRVDLALGILRARVGHDARVDAVPFSADLSVATLVVGPTTSRWWWR